MAAPKKTTIHLNDILALAPPFALAPDEPAPRTLLVATRDGGVTMLGHPAPDAVEDDDPAARQPA